MTGSEAPGGSKTSVLPEDGGPVSKLAVFNGSMILFVRQLLGYGLKIIGLFLITRVLGPERYAAYVAATSLTQYPTSMFLDGLNAFLVLGGRRVSSEQESNAHTILGIASLALIALVFLLVKPLSDWMNVPEAGHVMMVLVFYVPFQLLAVPSFARLERRLAYREIATVELMGQVAYYAVAAPLVMLEFGPVGLAYGFVVQWIVSFCLSVVFAKSWPKFHFHWSVAREILRFSVSYSVVSWTWQLRSLINPLVVGPLLGPHALGIVGMANTVVELAAFAKAIIYRISLAVLGRYKEDAAQLRKAMTYGLQFQTLVVGAVLLGFGWFSGWIVPLAFGPQWMPILALYPFIALGFLANAQFNVHAAVLIALNRPFEVIMFHLTHVVLFLVTAVLVTPYLGLTGYGFGELAAIPAYLVLHFYAARRVGSPDYLVGAIWIAGAGLGLFWRELGAWTIAAPFVALALPPSFRLLRDNAEHLWREKMGHPQPAPADPTAGSSQGAPARQIPVIILSTSPPNAYRSHLATALRDLGSEVVFVYLNRRPVIHTASGEPQTMSLWAFIGFLRGFCSRNPDTLVLNSTTVSYPVFSIFLRLWCGGTWCYDLYDHFVFCAEPIERPAAWIAHKLLAATSHFVVRPSLTSAELVPSSLYLPSASHLRPIDRPDPDFDRVIVISSFDKRADFDFLDALAKCAPNRRIDLAGRVYDRVQDQLTKVVADNPNIRYLGPYDDAKLDTLLSSYSIMLAPYVMNSPTTRYIDPNRYRHGLNSGMEVVTTDVPYAHALGSRLHIVTTAAEAAAVIDKLEHDPSSRLSLGRDGPPFQWSEVAETLLAMTAMVRQGGLPRRGRVFSEGTSFHTTTSPSGGGGRS